MDRKHYNSIDSAENIGFGPDGGLGNQPIETYELRKNKEGISVYGITSKEKAVPMMATYSITWYHYPEGSKERESRRGDRQRDIAISKNENDALEAILKLNIPKIKLPAIERIAKIDVDTLHEFMNLLVCGDSPRTNEEAVADFDRRLIQSIQMAADNNR